MFDHSIVQRKNVTCLNDTTGKRVLEGLSPKTLVFYVRGSSLLLEVIQIALHPNHLLGPRLAVRLSQKLSEGGDEPQR